MTRISEWPDTGNTRVLTLVGNDITIDTRARKTASSLARAGFSVVACGLEGVGGPRPPENLDGAAVVRVGVPRSPGISPRLLRVSRAELADSFAARSETIRLRLQLLRRNFVADIEAFDTSDRGVFRFLGRSWSFGSRLLRLPPRIRAGIRGRIAGVGLRVRRFFHRFPRRFRIRLVEIRLGLYSAFARSLARPVARRRRSGNWRRDLPDLHRFEAALGPIVDTLKPDLIHVHDIFHLGVAVRAKARAAAQGRMLRVVYDIHEHVAGLPIDPLKRAGYLDLEREYVGGADGFVTVSPGLAALVQEGYGKSASLVLNAPDTDTAVPAGSVRSTAGLAESVRLAVHVGGIAPHRGSETLIRAMSFADPIVHLVFVAASMGGYVTQLQTLAAELGVGDRVHFVPYVAPEAVVPYISSADLSVICLSRDVPNYEVALPNKLFQAVQAKLPVVVSDNPDMAEFVARHGIGAVFPSTEPEALAEAMMSVLGDRDRFVSMLDDLELQASTTWRAQADALLRVYRDLGVVPD